MASMLARAASRFDTAFAALPPDTRAAIALAMHRAAPAIEQYQRDLEPLTRDAAIADAWWDVAFAVAFKLMKKGRDGDWSKEFAEVKAAAPATADFIAAVGRLIDGVMPGTVFARPDVGAEPAIAPRALPPADEGKAG